MKRCNYCGAQNSEDAVHCCECSSSDLVSESSPSPPASPKLMRAAAGQADLLPRDRPKLVIVLGIWAFFLTGLVANLMVFFAVFTGWFSESNEWLILGFTVIGSGVCIYMLYRATRNYKIHRRRSAEEQAAENRLATSESSSNH